MVEPTFMYGKHAVREALIARPDVVCMVHLAEDTQDTELERLAEKCKVAIKRFSGKKLPKGIAPDAVHQGAIAEIHVERLVRPYEDFIQKLPVSRNTALVVLGEIQDPQNVGAIIRSAAAFGIAGVLIPEHRQAQVNGTVIKVSAGMAFRIPLVAIGNVNNTLENLKQHGFWTYGLDGTSTQTLGDEGFEKPSVFILGNEGTGVRVKTLEHCDIQLRIPMHAQTESLNAAAAAAVTLYAWSVKHPEAQS